MGRFSKHATCSCRRDDGSDRRSRLHSFGLRGRLGLQTMTPPAPDSLVPQSAFFLGLGGGWDSANFGNQNVFGKGTSFTPPTGGHVTPQIGSAQGSTGLDLDTHTALAPTIQAGYFQHFFGTPWMWGGKLTYSYLGIGSARNSLLIPQSGGFTQDGEFTPFVGNFCSSPIDRPLIIKYRLFPSSAGRLKEAIYIWEQPDHSPNQDVD